MRPLLTTPQVAEMLGVSPQQVIRMRVSGRLRALNISLGRRPTWRFRESDIEAFLSGREPEPQVKAPRRQRREAIKEYV